MLTVLAYCHTLPVQHPSPDTSQQLVLFSRFCVDNTALIKALDYKNLLDLPSCSVLRMGFAHFLGCIMQVLMIDTGFNGAQLILTRCLLYASLNHFSVLFETMTGRRLAHGSPISSPHRLTIRLCITRLFSPAATVVLPNATIPLYIFLHSYLTDSSLLY